MSFLRDLLGLVLAPALLFAALLGPDLPLPLPVQPYEDGVTPVFLDRPYRNLAPSPALAGLRVVPVPRHLVYPVELELSEPTRVLRLWTARNDDRPFADWHRVEGLALEVEGRSCVFTGAFERELAPGLHRLPPGGPVAAAPILVGGDGAVRARTVASWNKLTPGPNPVDFVMRNKRKLAGLTLLYVGWSAWFWRRGRRGRLSGRARSPGPRG